VRSSSHTNGAVAFDSHSIGRAMITAIGSGERSANCLGTSSPITRLTNVVTTMTSPKPSWTAVSCDTPSSSSRWPTGNPSREPEKAPAKIPISVIPICTVDRNRPGSLASLSAHCAPPLPALASALSRASRADTIAISLIDSTPLSATRAMIRSRLNQGKGTRGALMGRTILVASGRARQAR